jgi:hypothetical protein
MSSKPWSDTTEFSYDQVDKDLGFSEPEDKDDARAFDAFKRVMEWVMRDGESRRKPSATLVYRRISVVAWLMQPSRKAGQTARALAEEHDVSEDIIAQDAFQFRRFFGIAGPQKRKAGQHDGIHSFAA